jgi:hypothetical protein
MPHYVVEDACRDALDLGLPSLEATEVQAFIEERLMNIRTLVNAHRAEFRGMQQWRLTT